MSLPAVESPPTPPSGPHRVAVSESVYWRDYYELSDTAYEWNNGYLEEKPVSDFETGEIYRWFLSLLERYLETRPVAKITVLDMGFRMALPNKKVIRKPDLGVVCNANPVALDAYDRSFHGVFDLCVEALSDSTREEKERDTVVKKSEYMTGGVPEYYILHHDKDLAAFYCRNEWGIYTPLPVAEGIVRSRVLPGFQFRIEDLLRRPGVEKMMRDAVYQEFVLPAWRTAEQRAAAETRRAEAEARRAEAAEAEVARLQALLEQKR